MTGSAEVGERIRAARKHASLSQDELAERLHMGQATYSRIERGLTDARGSAIATIADICGVSPDWLLLGRGDGPSLDAATAE